MTDPTPARTIRKSGLYELDADGNEMTRQQQCLCGKHFKQFKIAFRYVEGLALGRGEKTANEFMRQIPDGWVPVNCPPCESAELGRRANVVSYQMPEPRRGAA